MIRSPQKLARNVAAAFDFDVGAEGPPRRPPGAAEPTDRPPDPNRASPDPVSHAAG